MLFKKKIFIAPKIYVPNVCTFCILRKTQKVTCHFRRKALHKHTQYNLKQEIKLREISTQKESKNLSHPLF